MSNVVSLERSCEYFVSRAARHRRAGRYDEAMALLSNAKDQFGLVEAIELETAETYEAIGCDQEAARSYLRVVRLKGNHRAKALFRLAVLSARKADLLRAASYYQQFRALKDHREISAELDAELGTQLHEEMLRPCPAGRKGRARQLERRAVERLQQGKIHAAKRTLVHAAAHYPTAQRFVLLACCCLMNSEESEAVDYAQKARALSPGSVPALCVLADAYASSGDMSLSRRALYLAAIRAKSAEDLVSVAMESAKFGESVLTQRLARALLKRDPFHTQAMLLMGCALADTGRLREASRLFGRLCGLLPEDTVCEAFYRLTSDGIQPDGPLGLGLEIPRQEYVQRSTQLYAMLYGDLEEIRKDNSKLRTACRICAWAVRSQAAGQHASTAALIVLSSLDCDAARNTLLDMLTDPQVPDGLKTAVLQILTAREGFQPYDVDFGGRLVRLAAGGVSERPVGEGEANARVVQRVADALSPDFPDAPQLLLPVYLAYLKTNPPPAGRREDACAAALEYLYHLKKGHTVELNAVARQYDVSRRLVGVFVKKLERIQQEEYESEE